MGRSAVEIIVPSSLTTFNHLVRLYPMERVKASNTVLVQWLVVGLLSLGLQGCSLQKRTTLPGWHWEHEKIAIHHGLISKAETFPEDRGQMVDLRLRGTSFQSEVDPSRTLQVSEQSFLPERGVETMTMLVASELDDAKKPSILMLSSADLENNSESETIEDEPNNWLVVAFMFLGFGLAILPSPMAGILIGLAPFIFSLGQLVRLSRLEEAKKKKSQGKKFGSILLMLASVFVTIGLTSFLAFLGLVDAVEGIGWSFPWSYTGPG